MPCPGPGPALVDVVTDPNALSIPPDISEPQIKGFVLAAGGRCSPAASVRALVPRSGPVGYGVAQIAQAMTNQLPGKPSSSSAATMFTCDWVP